MGKYEDNYEKIFGTDDERKARIRPGKQYFSHGERSEDKYPTILREIEPFKSPIDGSVISTRQERDAHFKQHGVTDSRDYSTEYFARRQKERNDRLTGRTPEARQQRIDLLKRQMRMD